MRVIIGELQKEAIKIVCSVVVVSSRFDSISSIQQQQLSKKKKVSSHKEDSSIPVGVYIFFNSIYTYKIALQVRLAWKKIDLSPPPNQRRLICWPRFSFSRRRRFVQGRFCVRGFIAGRSKTGACPRVVHVRTCVRVSVCLCFFQCVDH